jgi:hypothetical protein
MDDNQYTERDTEADQEKPVFGSRMVGSGSRMACSSENAVSASSKEIPCLATLARAFVASQMKCRLATVECTYIVHGLFTTAWATHHAPASLASRRDIVSIARADRGDALWMTPRLP